MKLIKVTCEVRFKERMKILGSYETLHRELLKEEPKNIERWLAPGIRLQDKERKRVVVVDSNKGVIDVELPSNVGNCKDLIIQFFRTVDKEFEIPQIGRWGVRSTWIEEYQGSFKDLLLCYKKNIFNDSMMAGKADDVGVVLDYILEEKTKMSLTTGPMEKAQLTEQFLTFKPVNVPPVLLYASIDVGDMNVEKFSIRYLEKCLARAIAEGEKLALEVRECIGGKK